MNNSVTFQPTDLSTYRLWTHAITHQQWLNLSVAWSEAGASVLETATVSQDGHLQCHILDHGTRIHAIYTLIDVPAIAAHAGASMTTQDYAERKLSHEPEHHS